MTTSTMDLTGKWSKETIKSLRLRLGWSQGDLARRLGCASTDVDSWEKGVMTPSPEFLNGMFLIAKQADVCSHEVQFSPLAENHCDQHALAQIEFSEIKEEIE